MINIDVKEMNNKIIELNNTIDEYNLTYLNLFNSINQLSESWISNNATNFFACMEHEKIETEELINSMKSQKDIYKYIYENYREIGNKVKCNLDAKDTIFTKVDNCIYKTKEIINLYQDINITKNYEEKESINKKYESTKKVLNKYKCIKENIKRIYGKIEEIEHEINRKLENIEPMQVDELEIG